VYEASMPRPRVGSQRVSYTVIDQPERVPVSW
jgi:hypothetical protein